MPAMILTVALGNFRDLSLMGHYQEGICMRCLPCVGLR